MYERLRNNERFKGKLKLDEATNRLAIVFHDYLRLDYSEGGYTSAHDEGLIKLNGHVTHWHIDHDDDAIETVMSTAKGDIGCIENHTFLGNVTLKMMQEEKFREKKERYMKKKSLRIYTATAIIKEEGYKHS